ncbi:probable zinc finger CCHC domain-containing protein 8 at N-terminal half [Coccomyxa sp. Obi]|nr:probable zinc finger CCHC domain-containing protein 8 at N-terminal half [Coccomyxa sp. Obi]
MVVSPGGEVLATVEVAVTADIPVLSGTLEFSPSLLNGASNAAALVYVDKPSRSASPKRSKLGFNLSYEMAGEVPRYDCSSEQPLDAQDAERRLEERLGSSSRSGGLADLGTPVTKYVMSTSRRPRPRCFNCGSYYHALKDCLHSKDSDAISRARSEHSERGRNGFHGSSRYFLQTGASDAEFSDLEPGVLSQELRAAMGLKHEDPPPWLHRMRQMGYPPGYRRQAQEDSDNEMLIFEDSGAEMGPRNGNAACADQNGDVNGHGGEVEELVAFPGLNAPIPANADPAVWFGQPPQALVNGMTLEERGIKREHYSACAEGDPSAEHSAKRARTSAPQSHFPASLAPLPQHVAYGQPSYDPYGYLYQTPPPVQHPYGHQLPAQLQGSNWGVSPGQQWPPQQPGQQGVPAYNPTPVLHPTYTPLPSPPTQTVPQNAVAVPVQPLQWPSQQPPQQPGQQGAPAYNPPAVLHPTYTPLPAPAAQTVPQNTVAVPVQPLQQLPGGYPNGQLGGSFQAAAYAAYIGSYQQPQQSAAAAAPPLYQYAGSSAPVPQQQQQQHDSMQWAVHSTQFRSIVGEPPPPPPPG